MDCLILGDSIAKGISHVHTECVAYVQTGITSTKFKEKFHGPWKTDVGVISLGSNDYDTLIEENLRNIRENLKAGTVYWVLPNIKEDKRAIVKKIAEENNDIIIDARKYPKAPAGVHPTGQGYLEMSKQIE